MRACSLNSMHLQAHACRTLLASKARGEVLMAGRRREFLHTMYHALLAALVIAFHGEYGESGKLHAAFCRPRLEFLRSKAG